MADQAAQQEITIKEASFPSCDHSFTTHYRRNTYQLRNNQLQHIKREETTLNCPATMPRGLGTPLLN